METVGTSNKREFVQSERKGLGVKEVLLIGILLAAGAALKFFVGSVINFGMKPNFIISMYCLIILLIRPNLKEAAIIGILSGAVCQFFPGQPYINFVSELAGAIVMCVLTMLPVKTGLARAKTVLCTFFSTLVSGFTFIGVMYVMYFSGADITPTPLAAFMAIIFGTAFINSIIVQALYTPLRLALKK
ncbi:MAG: hypothetical protein LBQ19_05915 [Synergistaceae bacterium]|jgi:hypothetical protein|nr:hypothetical protein [Synergistaceae bacterium]